MNLNEDSEHRAIHLCLRIKLALAIAIIRSKPRGLTGGQFAAQLSLSYQKHYLDQFKAVKRCSHLMPLFQNVIDTNNLEQNKNMNLDALNETSILFNMSHLDEMHNFSNSISSLTDFVSDNNLLNLCLVALNSMDFNVENNNNHHSTSTFKFILSHLFNIIIKDQLSEECLLISQKFLILLSNVSALSKRQIVIDFINQLLLKFVEIKELQSDLKERLMQYLWFLIAIDQLYFLDIFELLLNILLQIKDKLLLAELTKYPIEIHIMENIGILLQLASCHLEKLESLLKDNESEDLIKLYDHWIKRESCIKLIFTNISNSMDFISEFNPLFVIVFYRIKHYVEKIYELIKIGSGL